MNIEQIIYPIKSLGPGNRVAIWTRGCKRRCPGCSNPELWTTEESVCVSVDSICAAIAFICKDNLVDGVTITGGEPFEQSEELFELVRRISATITDILVFTGYTYEEICLSKEKAKTLEYISVLVEGRYIEEQNKQLPLRGSSNQRIMLFDSAYERIYKDYLQQPYSTVQNLHFSDSTISVGIHAKDFPQRIETILQKKGLRRNTDGKNEMA